MPFADATSWTMFGLRGRHESRRGSRIFPAAYSTSSSVVVTGPGGDVVDAVIEALRIEESGDAGGGVAGMEVVADPIERGPRGSASSSADMRHLVRHDAEVLRLSVARSIGLDEESPHRASREPIEIGVAVDTISEANFEMPVRACAA